MITKALGSFGRLHRAVHLRRTTLGLDNATLCYLEIDKERRDSTT